MNDLIKNRRDYCIFVVLSFLITFVLPLLLSALHRSLSHSNVPIDCFWFRQFILSFIRAALDIVKTFPTAFLLFAAMRWAFWYSVPVIFGGMLYSITTLVSYYSIESGFSQQSVLSLMALMTLQIITSVCFTLFYLKLTRVVFLRVKNNFITVPVMLIIMLVVGSLNTVLWAYIISLFLPISPTGFSLSVIVDSTIKYLPNTLLGDLYGCIVYVILYFSAKFFDKRRCRLNTDE